MLFVIIPCNWLILLSFRLNLNLCLTNKSLLFVPFILLFFCEYCVCVLALLVVIWQTVRRRKSFVGSSSMTDCAKYRKETDIYFQFTTLVHFNYNLRIYVHELVTHVITNVLIYKLLLNNSYSFHIFLLICFITVNSYKVSFKSVFKHLNKAKLH